MRYQDNKQFYNDEYYNGCVGSEDDEKRMLQDLHGRKRVLISQKFKTGADINGL